MKKSEGLYIEFNHMQEKFAELDYKTDYLNQTISDK